MTNTQASPAYNDSDFSIRKIAFALSLVMIFMMPWEGVLRLAGLGSSGPTLVKFLGFSVTGFWVVTILITGQFRKPSLFHIVVSIFVLWNALSVFWSGDVNRTVSQLGTWVLVLGLTFIIWDLYTTPSRIFAGLQAYIFGAYVATAIAFANFSAGNAFYTRYQRFSPDDTNPDGFGFILALGIPVAWYLATSNNVKINSTWLKLINFAFIPTAFIGLALSGTRTALIGTVPGMLFGIWTLFRTSQAMRLAVILLLVVSIIIIIPYAANLTSFQRFATIIDEITAGDLTGRTVIWSEGLDAFADHPLLGVGSNMYRSVNSIGKVAHNSFLSVLVELGLVGFLLFGLILTIAVIQAWRQPKWEKRFWITMIIIWTIGASTLTWEYRKTTWLFLGLLVANAAIYQLSEREVPATPFGESDSQLLLDSKGST